MTSAIMLSLVIPALVAITLTVLLIKERDYFFNHKQLNNRRTIRVSKKDHSKKNPDDHTNDNTYIDYSGGMLGL